MTDAASLECSIQNDKHEEKEFRILCRNRKQAEEVAGKINRKEHDDGFVPSAKPTLERKMEEVTFIIEQESDGGFVAQSAGHGMVTQADTHDQLLKNIREVIEVYFDRPEDMPKKVRLHFVRDEVFAL